MSERPDAEGNAIAGAGAAATSNVEDRGASAATSRPIEAAASGTRSFAKSLAHLSYGPAAAATRVQRLSPEAISRWRMARQGASIIEDLLAHGRSDADSVTAFKSSLCALYEHLARALESGELVGRTAGGDTGGGATSIAPAAVARSSSGGATRIAPAAVARTSSGGGLTRIAPAAVARTSSGGATSIAPAAVARTSSGGATSIAPAAVARTSSGGGATSIAPAAVARTSSGGGATSIALAERARDLRSPRPVTRARLSPALLIERSRRLRETGDEELEQVLSDFDSIDRQLVHFFSG